MIPINKAFLKPDDYILVQYTDYTIVKYGDQSRSKNEFSYCRVIDKPFDPIQIYLQKIRVMGEAFYTTTPESYTVMYIPQRNTKIFKLTQEEFEKHVLMEIV